MQEDLKNYMRVKLDPNANILLKDDVVPRFFDCQSDRKRAWTTTERPGAKKLRHARTLAEIEEEHSRSISSTSAETVGEMTVNESATDSSTSDVFYSNTFGSPAIAEARTSSLDVHISSLSLNDTHGVTSKPNQNLTRNVGVQVHLKTHFRSVRVQCKPDTKDASCSPIKSVTENDASDPASSNLSSSQTTSSQVLNNTLENCEEYLPSDEESEESSQGKLDSKSAETLTLRLERIEKNPKMYIGVPDHALFVLQLLGKAANLKVEHLYLTLEKIKRNSPFALLGDEYGKSCSFAAEVFRKTVPVMAQYLKRLVFWPSAKTIKSVLPLPFRARHGRVQSIIDCFEIEIQKPSDSVHQSCSWSDYKKCNTLKYLISATPDGMINFISGGFGGRATDAVITEASKFLDQMAPKCEVMADRGFKHIA